MAMAMGFRRSVRCVAPCRGAIVSLGVGSLPHSTAPWRSFAGASRARGSGESVPEAVITRDAAAYWREVMKKVDKPGLGGLLGSLDWGHPLGLTRRRAGGQVQCYDDFLNAKRRHPTALVLVRIGDFYEAVGFDALVLCQVCGLNPMSPHSGVAEAGFPKGAQSLRRQLNRLIEASFTVAVVEEVGVRAAASRSGGPGGGGGFVRAFGGSSKERRLVSLVSACSPYYLHGDVEDEYDGDDTPLPKPITGVSVPSVGGYRLLRFCPTSRTIQVFSQLSAEALVAQLHASGLAQPLHVHASVRERERAGDRGLPLARSLGALLGVSIAEFGTPGPAARGARAAGPPGDVEQFAEIVGRALGVHASALKVVVPALPADTPVPPSLSTIAQMGLGGARSVPSLLAAALPPSAPAACRDWLRRLLLLPPPPAVAEGIRTACAALAAPGPGAAPPLPPLVTSLQGPRLAALLAEGAAGHNTLRELRSMLLGAAELLQLPGPSGQALAGALGGRVLAWSLDASAGISWSEVPPAVFAQHCLSAAGAIGALLPDLEPGAEGGALGGLGEGDEEGEEEGEDEDEYGDEDEADSPDEGGAGPATLGPGGLPAHLLLSPDELLAHTIPPELHELLHPHPHAHGPHASAPAAPSAAAGAAAPAGCCCSGGGGGPGLRGLRLAALAEAGRLVSRMERFRQCVRPERMPAHVERVAAARRAYVSALLRAAGVLEAAAAAVPGAGAAFALAAHDDAVWGRLVTAASAAPGGAPNREKKKLSADLQRAVLAEAGRLAAAASPPLALAHPLNRKRATEADRWSSAEAEEAGAAYRLAVEAADKEARRLLRQLCAELYGAPSSARSWGPRAPTAATATTPSPSPSAPSSPPGGHLVTLLAAVELSVVAGALREHVARAKALGWNWPTMPPVPAPSPSAPGPPGGGVRLSLPGLVPYWMDRRDAVPNDLQLSGGCMALLTGPNMAGKSTVLRSIAAAALLATCGLAVPAGSPSSPPSTSPLPLEGAWLSHVSLRNFSGDSPLEGKSAFAVEMEDTAHTLALAEALGPRALVLLDELGKGTELVAGTALAGAVLSALSASGCCGVLASHLHDLVFLGAADARAGRLAFWAMEVQEDGPQPPGSLVPLLSPTRRVRVGATCMRSLAMQVAASCGMPDDVLATAVALERQLGAVLAAARGQAFGGEGGAEWGAGAGAGGGGFGLGAAGLDLGAGAGVGGGAAGSRGALGLSLEQLGEQAMQWAQSGPPPELLGLGPGLGQAAGPAQAGPRQGQGQGQGGAAGGRGVHPHIPGLLIGRELDVAAAMAEEAAEWAPAAAAAEVAEGLRQWRQGPEAGVVGPAAADAHAGPGPTSAALSAILGPDFRALDTADPEQCIAAASEMLRAEVRGALAKAGRELGPEDGQLHWVSPEYTPHTGHAGEAAVYVLRRWDGLLYVGESEDVAARLKAHRAAETRERRQAGQALKQGRRNVTTLVAVYTLVPRAAGGKSSARDVEAGLIRALQRRGVALRSDHDRRRDGLHRPQLPGEGGRGPPQEP
ncbi:hypothetical protein HYH03_002423 [Edaphochlamys debaryana]|uniref:DNA mismatch repair proteins mutS family domain-containing protein n=1 Tax=Edaphochlamys debaryana TaxID=47281 RepID=A0A835YEL4_9CHLO|nr:hypothetical protein HYH03_002423 [Edaphochlamys debaryana]|eukprot:KAG2499476.1 hypothetical protein HYH03_002423 [Edaphochlamys debaryana]